MPGQINRESALGDIIHGLSMDSRYSSYLEIGTWNGEGSTKCFIDGLLQREDNWSFYSLETSVAFYNAATSFWGTALEDDRINLLLGRIVDPKEVMTINQIQEKGKMKPQYTGFLKEDLENYQQVENVWEKLPPFFDVVLLDGGEFSTLAEFEKLKDITKIFILDDSNALKTREIRDTLDQSARWSTLYRNDRDRNGCSAYEKL